MLNFLFWNTGGKSVIGEIASLVVSGDVNVLVLAEHEKSPQTGYQLMRALHARDCNFFVLPSIGCDKIKVFTDIDPGCFHLRYESSRFTIQELLMPGCVPVLLSFLHFPSKLYKNDKDQLMEAIEYRHEIEAAEQAHKNVNTVIVGDFNMNPFDDGMTFASAFHALPCLRTAQLGSRIIKGRPHSFFYNPTWNLFGDRDGVPGTFFRAPRGHSAMYWYLLDQLILRPSIGDRLDKRSLRIITKAGNVDLLNSKGRPTVSGHLPISFSLDLNLEVSHEKSLA